MNTTNTTMLNEAAVACAARSYYFAHQSVGGNILRGISSRYGSLLSVEEGSDPSKIARGVILHAKTGKNYDPKSKIDAFCKSIDDGIGGKVDVAILKFCYVDVNASTDVDDLFAYYCEKIESLQKKYPSTKFIHTTVPLTSEQYVSFKSRLKNYAKKLAGKKTYVKKSIEDNIRRTRYNEMLRSRYGSANLFDLAAVESSLVDGSALFSREGGVSHQLMNSLYTDDGGHLNVVGSTIAADAFMKFFANK